MIGLGIGIYTPGDAAALLHEKPATVRRWAFGYRRNRETGRAAYPPLIRTELPVVEGERALTFVELVELLYVRAFHAAGASWRTIREAARVAARLYASDHPFALRQVYVDPAKLLYGAVREPDGSEALIQLRGHGQQVFPELVKPYLDQLEFDAGDVAARWWPLGKEGRVVIDPARSFGAPILEETGIRTKTLVDTCRTELERHGGRTVDHVAWLFEISPRDVDAALEFDQWLRKAA